MSTTSTTPASGAISANNMRESITRSTTTALSMSEVRTRYGLTSGAISFGDLYKVAGFTIAPVHYTFTSKGVNVDELGYNYRQILGGAYGSCVPNDANGVQLAANSYLGGIRAQASTNTNCVLGIEDNTSSYTGDSTTVTSGYYFNNLNRIVTENVSRTITASNTTSGQFTYQMPDTGTIHCIIKFV